MDGLDIPKDPATRICLLAQEFGIFRDPTDDILCDITDIIIHSLLGWIHSKSWHDHCYECVSKYPKDYWTILPNVQVFTIEYENIFNKAQTLIIAQTGVKLV